MEKIDIVGSNIIERGGKILLMQESFEKVRGKWNLPAGKLDVGEDIITCASREGEEETGFKIKPLYLVGIYQNRLALPNSILFVFKSEILGGKLTVPEEAMDVRWFSFDEIKELNEKRLLRLSCVWKAIEDYKAGKKMPLSSITILD